MTYIEKISLATVIINCLIFCVMAITLYLHGRALKLSRKDTELTLLAVKSQSLATLIMYLERKISQLDPKAGLDVQRERQEDIKILNKMIVELDNIMKKLADIKEDN